MNAIWYALSFIALFVFVLVVPKTGPQDGPVYWPSFIGMLLLWTWTIRATANR